MIGKAPPSSYSARHELHQRLGQPQRHRLLHGYPMAPLMRPARSADQATWRDREPRRPLLVGVLPHTACNPKLKGCGFCTFPHERFERRTVETVVQHVIREITATVVASPSLRERPIGALYFGGGTANLTPPGAFADLTAALQAHFALGDAEISLEGAPVYFTTRKCALLDILGAMKGRHKRISMGVQTLDPRWLVRMGREAFGAPAEIREVVDEAHRRGFTVSADMLVTLPGRSLLENLRDIEACIALGVDQVCAYNLVLSPRFEIPWARDPAMLAALPDNDTACTVWRAARQLLLASGFVQTTLTNFERCAVQETPRQFLYESASFDPGTWDALGFGPAALSTFTDPRTRRAVKWSNATMSDAYVAAIAAGRQAVEREFLYEPIDVRLLHVTRGMAKLGVDRAAYRRFFGTDAVDDAPAQFFALEEARLVTRSDRALELTVDGMFYADAVVGLLAGPRVAELGGRGERLSVVRDHMG